MSLIDQASYTPYSMTLPSPNEKQDDGPSHSSVLERAVSPSPSRSSVNLINASGHKQELERQFSLLSICAVGITTGNTWIAMGGSLVSSRFRRGLFLSPRPSPLAIR
jgi:hypothetical protein